MGKKTSGEKAPEEKNKALALVASLLFVVAFALLCFALFKHFDFDLRRPGAQQEDATYCDMVKRYLDTEGREGWPDYRNIYYRQCVNRQP